MRDDGTIERNYLQQRRMLIAQYEAVKTGRSAAFSSIGEFYAYHQTCSQTFRKYYNRYRATGLTIDLFPRRRGPKHRVKSETDKRKRQCLKYCIRRPPILASIEPHGSVLTSSKL